MNKRVPIVASLPVNTLGPTNDSFFALGSLSNMTETTEANVEARFRIAGVFSNLWCNVNTVSSSSVLIRFRKDNGNGNQNVAVNSVGNAEDTTNVDYVSSGEDINLMYDRTSGQSGVAQTRILFHANGPNVVVPYIATSPGGFGISTTTRYFSPVEIGGATGETAVFQKEVFAAGTWSNLQVYTSANTKSATTTFRSRINAANGNMSVSFAAGVSGLAVDTSNSDALVVGDLLTISMEISGTGTITSNTVYSQIAYTSDAAIGLYSDTRTNATRTASATVHYLPILGNFQSVAETTESRVQVCLGVAGTISEFTFHITSNNYTGSSTAQLRINAANANSVVTLPATTNGSVKDSVNTDKVDIDDLLSIAFSGGTANTAALRGVSFKFTYANEQQHVFFM